MFKFINDFKTLLMAYKIYLLHAVLCLGEFKYAPWKIGIDSMALSLYTLYTTETQTETPLKLSVKMTKYSVNRVRKMNK